jgi:hypothetical protein
VAVKRIQCADPKCDGVIAHPAGPARRTRPDPPSQAWSWVGAAQHRLITDE